MPDRKDPGPRILFLGMQNAMSFQAFVSLLENYKNICGVALATNEVQGGGLANVQSGIDSQASQSVLPIVNRFVSTSIVQIATKHEIPIIPVMGNAMSGLQKAIAAFQPEIACIACFPLRLPEYILASVKYGFVNLHPAMLPAHRGPVPLFWIFRSVNQEESGVTVHRVDEGLDSGDIVLQQRVDFDSGISGLAADRICGELGGVLLAKAARGLWDGTIESHRQPPGGNYDPWPIASDFQLDSSWSAERAFNFMRGTAHWNRVYPTKLGEETIELSQAIAWYPDSRVSDGSTKSGNIVFVKFRSGILEARRI